MGTLDFSILKKISPQESSLWEFYFLDLPTVLKPNKSKSGIASALTSFFDFGAGLMYYKYLVQSTSISPLRNLELAYDEASRKYYHTAVSSFENVSITFQETEQFSANYFLTSLQSRTYSNFSSSFVSGDPTIIGILVFSRKHREPLIDTQSGLISDFKRTVAEKARVLKTGQVFILRNMKLSTVGGYSLNYTSTEPLTIDATFTVEEIISLGLGSFVNMIS